MDLVKKNIVSIICGVIALLAIAAVFWPISGMFANLQQRTEAQRTVYGNLEGLLKKNRTLPTLDLVSSEPKPLEMFPTEKMIERGRQATEAVKSESQRMLATAEKINKKDKELLVPDALPGSPGMPGRRFRDQYKQQMDVRNDASNFVKLLQSGSRPTQQDVQAAIDRKKQDIETNELAKDLVTGAERNRPQIDAKIAQMRAGMPDRMRQETAERIKVYLEPGALDIHPQIDANPNFPPQPVAIFWAQVGLWVQRDIARSIAEVNANAKNVMDATVKHIVKIDVPEAFAKPVAQPQPGGDEASAGVVAAGPSDPAAKIEKNPSVSPTGRFSNGLYDSVHFRMQLVCDADRVPAVLTALSRDKFITIFQSNMLTLDPRMKQAEGFVFGPRPVVLLDLQGEALFMRQWTVPIMPQHLKQSMGITEPQQPPPG